MQNVKFFEFPLNLRIIFSTYSNFEEKKIHNRSFRATQKAEIALTTNQSQSCIT